MKSFIFSIAFILLMLNDSVIGGLQSIQIPTIQLPRITSGKNAQNKLVSNGLRGGIKISTGAQPDTSGIDIHYLRLDIKANDTTTYIEGIAEYLVNITNKGITDIILELTKSLIIDSIFIDRTKVGYNHSDDYVTILLPSTYSIGREINLQIFYHGAFQPSGFFSGISNGKDYRYGIPVTWTLSEPFGAKDWFPAKQVLTDKIDSVDMNITTRARCLAGANGTLTGISILNDGSKCHHWKSRYPIDYYLISFTVSNYQDYRIYAHPKGSMDSILIQNYLYNLPVVLSANKAGIDQTAQFVELFSSLFGPYPFDREKYGHCMAPIGGGMEHQTMTTLSGFDFGLVAHELSHMWFGDHVTCGSWQDIWLNEGFASYAEYLAHQIIEGDSSGYGWMMHAHDQAMSIPDHSIYIPINQIANPIRIFNDAISYKKGASIIHMLRYEINNDSIFFSILREYNKRFAYGTATGEDFRMVTEDLTRKDFQWFFDQWYYGEGYPTINIFWNQKSRLISINTNQIPSATTPLFKTSMDLKLMFKERDTTVRIWIDNTQNHFEFNSGQELVSVIVDPNHWLLNKYHVLQSPEASEFNLYPNPFSGQIQIDFYKGSKTRFFRLTDMNGRLIYTFSSADKNIYIDSIGLAQGIYLLNIIEDDKSWQLKIVKDKDN